jgi:DNA-binding response OmpR family regulator
MDGDTNPYLLDPLRRADPRATRVLIVEDDPILAANARDILEAAAFVVTGIAASLREAQSLLETVPPALALVDLNLADGRTGARIAALLAEAGCAVVMATGQPRDVPPGTPAHAILPKPYSPHVLIGALRAAARDRTDPALSR